MDSEKLIERLRTESLYADKASLEIMDLCMDAATALSTLQAENSQLRESRDHWKRLAHELVEGVNGKDAEHERLQAENEKLQAELDDLKAKWDKYQPREHWETLNELCENLHDELEKVKQDRDSIEQDFRAFAKQWWEEDSGFPCRWCKFENSGGCEWKAKQPNEEKICAGRAFEWRGQKED